eukprot:gene11914-24956_t
MNASNSRVGKRFSYNLLRKNHFFVNQFKSSTSISKKKAALILLPTAFLFKYKVKSSADYENQVPPTVITSSSISSSINDQTSLQITYQYLKRVFRKWFDYLYPLKPLLDNVTATMRDLLALPQVVMMALLKYQNIIAKKIQNMIPLNFQFFFRDNGGIKYLFNVSTILFALSLCILRPSISLSHIQLSQKIESLSYKNTPNHYIELLHINDENNDSVLVFVHGGAWGSGEPWMYRNIAYNMGVLMKAHSVAIVGYPVYPEANIFQQQQSIIDAMNYIRSLSRFNSNTRFILTGHSSGAHISALAIVSSAKAGRHLVDGFIGLSGVYDIDKHYEWESDRGVQHVSPMGAAAISIEKFWESSPTALIPHHKDELTRFPPTLLIHGEQDVVVPTSSSRAFAAAIEAVCPNIHTCYPEDCDHLLPILHMLQSGVKGLLDLQNDVEKS